MWNRGDVLEVTRGSDRQRCLSVAGPRLAAQRVRSLGHGADRACVGQAADHGNLPQRGRMGAGRLRCRGRRAILFSQAGRRAQSGGGCPSGGGAPRSARLVAAPPGPAPARPRRGDPREYAGRPHSDAPALRSAGSVTGARWVCASKLNATPNSNRVGAGPLARNWRENGDVPFQTAMTGFRRARSATGISANQRSGRAMQPWLVFRRQQHIGFLMLEPIMVAGSVRTQ